MSNIVLKNIKWNTDIFHSVKQRLQDKKKMTFHIASDSMFPLLKKGDLIEVVPLLENRNILKRFDIIIFLDRERLICHYVWNMNTTMSSMERPLVVTRSYFNSYEDDIPISYENIMGVVDNYQVPFKKRFSIVFLNLLFRKS